MAAIMAFGKEEAAITEAELEFLAEDELVKIVPNFRGEALNLIQVDAGPFRPQVPVDVPLWLALALQKRKKCTLLWPDWMTVERLTRILEMERETKTEFQPLSFHYIEIAQLLISSGQSLLQPQRQVLITENTVFGEGPYRVGENTEERYKVRSLIEDVRRVRFHKVEEGLAGLQRTSAIKLTNLSAMEVNIVRPFVLKALTGLDRYVGDVEPQEK